MTTRSHWENVDQCKASDEVSWYRPHRETSLRLIETVTHDAHQAKIDVGGGEARLVDDLVSGRHADVTVLHISQEAPNVARARIGPAAAAVHCIARDIATVALERSRYDVWRLRARSGHRLVPANRTLNMRSALAVI